MSICYCQISNKLINPPQRTLAETFYNSFWTEKNTDGYYKPEHFWEIPKWVAEINYMISGIFHIVTNINQPLPHADVYLFSVMDVNRHLIEYIIQKNPDKYFYLGGYTKPVTDFAPHVYWFESISDLCMHLDINYKYGSDYTLFKGYECVPRITLSTGCYHRCKFCTIPNGVTKKDYHSVIQQALSFEPLKFKFVYVDDKTFGQADNTDWLRDIYKLIKSYNPMFEGFIVQTTALMLNGPGNLGIYRKHIYSNIRQWKRDYYIKVIEFGLETYNDNLLRAYNKPIQCCLIDGAIKKLRPNGIKVIPNIMLGLPGETIESYTRTLNFIRTHADELYSLNIYTFADYDRDNLTDKNELHEDRSFWTREEQNAYHEMKDEFYLWGLKIVGGLI